MTTNQNDTPGHDGDAETPGCRETLGAGRGLAAMLCSRFDAHDYGREWHISGDCFGFRLPKMFVTKKQAEAIAEILSENRED